MRNLITTLAIIYTCAATICCGQDVEIHPWKPITKLVPVQQYTGFRSQDNVDRIWRKSPVAKHHDAVCRVQWSGGAGSGVCVQHDGTGAFVVTNQHVVSTGWNGNGFSPRTVQTATVTTHGGQSWSAAVIYSNQEDDIAILYSADASPKAAVPISDSMPPAGTEIEMCGIGGPVNGMRHFTGKVIDPAWVELRIDAPCVSGDSGGPMLWNGCLVGVNFGASGDGSRPLKDGSKIEGWSLNYPSSSRVTAGELRAVFTQICQPYGCQPIVRGPGRVVLSPTPVPVPVQPQACPPGPPGPTGEPGEKGDKGDPGADAVVTAEQLGAIAAAITSQLKQDPALRGPPGEVNPADIDAAVAAYFATHPNTISLSLVDENGTVLDTDTVELGGELKLQFVETAQ